MPILPKPKREPREKTLSVRISKTALDHLYKLQQISNLSQADILEDILKDELERVEAQLDARKGRR